MTRDAHLGLVPIGGHSSNPAFAVEIEDGGEAQMVIQALARDEMHSGLAEAVCGFVEEVAALLVAYGEAAYEIVPRVPEPDAGDLADVAEAVPAKNPHGLDLISIPPLSLRTIGSVTLQLVPRIGQFGLPGIMRVPTENVWRIQLPAALGGARGERRMLRYLDRLERRTRLLANPGEMPTGYDFAVAKRADTAASIKAMRRWGVVGIPWIEGLTAYFQVAGTLANRRAQAVLRDHIVEETNALLRRLDLPAIRIAGLPSVAEIDKALADLSAGAIDLVQAGELISIRPQRHAA